MLANIFLHYVYDLWVQHWRTKEAYGEVIVVRYADDTVVGFQYESEAKQFQEKLKKRLQKFGLELHPDKTRLIEFGRFAEVNRERRNEGKPDTFTFLGFTHICGKREKDGKFCILRHTIKKKMRTKLKEIKKDLRFRMHKPLQETGQWLRSVINGHNIYYGVPGNADAMSNFRYTIGRMWMKTVRRRSHKGRMTWEKFAVIKERWLPKPKCWHPFPYERFGV